jgi:hypothetical protein
MRTLAREHVDLATELEKVGGALREDQREAAVFDVRPGLDEQDPRGLTSVERLANSAFSGRQYRERHRDGAIDKVR